MGQFRARRINPFCAAASDIPAVRADHMETQAHYTTFGQKGIGEGGTIGLPTAIGNTVNDVLAALGVEVSECLIAPRRLRAAINAAAAPHMFVRYA